MTDAEALAALASSDPDDRVSAIRALEIRADPAHGPAIARMLDNVYELVSCEAADVLGILEYGPALDAIRGLLRDDLSELVRASRWRRLAISTTRPRWQS